MKRNILLVDDDDICNFLSSAILKSTGVANSIIMASNGEKALEHLGQTTNNKQDMPDVILLDINMPVMNGFEFMEAFQALSFPGKEKIRVIIVSSSVNPEDIERAKSFGIEHYLSKPISEDSIRLALN